MSDDFGLGQFEDPAPNTIGTDALSAIVSGAPRVAPKRRLRFRADVDVSDRRYKGRRVTREDIELDNRSLGLLKNEHELAGNDDVYNDVSDDSTPNEPFGGEGESSESEDVVENGDVQSSKTVSRMDSQGQEYSDDEESALARRLASSKKSDLKRAEAVRKQKSVYDAVVNLRIRLEPLISTARSFPSREQRECNDLWVSTEEVKESLQTSQNALQSLVAQFKSAWLESWPSESNDSDDAFDKWRDAVLNLWGRKVNDASGLAPKAGFKVFDTSVSGQVRAALASGKHLDRTRRVLNPITVLGGLKLDPGLHNMHFDDGEFYRALLREIIETGDAPGGSLRYAQLSKQGGVKKRRDSLHVKKHRLRYDVHEKMVGFLPPVPLPDSGPVDEIVANLFGKSKRQRK